MRTILNAVLAFIGATSLTDDEFNAIDPGLDTTDNEAVYDVLLEIIEDRESVSNFAERLLYYYKAKGEDFAAAEPETNILLGDALCDS